jgi:hypothetical protein
MTWEDGSRQDVLSLKDAAERHSAAGEWERAEGAYRAMFDLIGGREIRDEGVGRQVERARRDRERASAAADRLRGLRAVRDPGAAGRAEAVAGLRRAGEAAGGEGPVDEEALEALVRAAGDRDARVRRSAAEALGGFGRKAVPFLGGLSSDPDPGVVLAVLAALSEIGPDAKPTGPAVLGLMLREGATPSGFPGPLFLAAAECLVSIGAETDSAVPELAGRLRRCLPSAT